MGLARKEQQLILPLFGFTFVCLALSMLGVIVLALVLPLGLDDRNWPNLVGRGPL